MKKPFLLSYRVEGNLPPWAGNKQYSQMLVYGIDEAEATKKLKEEIMRAHPSLQYEEAIDVVNCTIE